MLILFKIIKKHRYVKIIEIPFVFKKRKYGRSKGNIFFAISYLIILIKNAIFFFDYQRTINSPQN
jgi:hypothetical protein